MRLVKVNISERLLIDEKTNNNTYIRNVKDIRSFLMSTEVFYFPIIIRIENDFGIFFFFFIGNCPKPDLKP